MSVSYKASERDSRPWGEWEVLVASDGYVVKRITVLPGKRLSLQSHRYRAEVWTVVSGEAEAVVGDRTERLSRGGTVRIAAGERHRMCNGGSVPMVFVEVQTGDILSEDDIVRYEDDYSRV
ncbi:MAG: phosphomannose isomerase type II C-terminal cupin domain [Victivallaceae bacterium]|nr:phosphomannose isomerase type II C-terminal cupin domain [Victivallaceae bacterium]